LNASHHGDRRDHALIDGPALGKLLFETGVPVLVLNACRSAHADPPAEPEKASDGEAARDPHDDVASFGSLALEVMDKGVSGVVAMRYNVDVVTAAQFVANVYGALAEGLSLGAAVSRGRKQLADRSERTRVSSAPPRASGGSSCTRRPPATACSRVWRRSL
jgi:hypothetical protein